MFTGIYVRKETIMYIHRKNVHPLSNVVLQTQNTHKQTCALKTTNKYAFILVI